MNHVFYEKSEIPIPPNGKINHYDGYVSIYFKDALGHRRRQVVGKATSDTTMHPNDRFKLLFPELWTQYYGDEELTPAEIHLGLYALTLGIGYKNGLYPLIHSAFGPLYGNALMDYAMYCMENRSNTAEPFADCMKDRMLFSGKVRDDAWLSRLFSEYMTHESILKMRSLWLNRCAQNGIRKVWVCIDGSNNDCDVTDSGLVEPGHAKSHQEREIVSYIWAVNAEDGMPITWSVNNGAMPDCKAVDEIIRLLAASRIEVEGVILDRGFPSEEVRQLIKSKGMKYIIMLKQNSNGFTEMFKRHASSIRWKVPYVVSTDATFGITDHCKAFAKSSENDCIGLFFDAVGAGHRAQKLIEKVLNVYTTLCRQADANEVNIKVPAEMKQFLSLKQEGQKTTVQIHWDIWQAETDAKGYYAIMSSETMAATQIHQLYKLRDISEKQFAILKSQLGFDVTRVHSDASIEGRFAATFVASIIRTEIALACKKYALDTNVMIRQANRINARLMPNNLYETIHSLSNDFKTLLNEFDLKQEHLVALAQDLNVQMMSGVDSQARTIPSLEPKPRKKTGPKPKAKAPEDANQPKRKSGRPKGSKSKSTLEREKLMASMPVQPKRKLGRPKGAKNKKTLEREALRKALLEKENRGRGRP